MIRLLEPSRNNPTRIATLLCHNLDAMPTDPRIAQTDADIVSCFDTIHQLRSHLSLDEFLARVRRQQKDGYRLACIVADGRVVATAGYRISEKLSCGRFLFVDDLVTEQSQRSRGYGAQLLSWLRMQAAAAGCSRLQLDTGVQRTDAQRFYEREGMDRVAYHYESKIG
jgi:GNAT superfamily N-acetyltransferase